MYDYLLSGSEIFSSSSVNTHTSHCQVDEFKKGCLQASMYYTLEFHVVHPSDGPSTGVDRTNM